jgi:hypothetical protein
MVLEGTTRKLEIKKLLDKGFRFAYTYKKADTIDDAIAKRNVASSSKKALETAYTHATYDLGEKDHEIKCWDLQTEYEKCYEQ